MNRQLTGLRAWTVQRLSALYMALFLLVAAGYLFLHPVHAFTQWHALLARPPVAVACVLLFIALLGHAWVGIRDIVLDYVRLPQARLLLLALLLGWLLVLAIWLLLIMLRVMI